MSSGFQVVSNGWGIVIFSEGPKVFGFPIMKASFSFTNVKTITGNEVEPDVRIFIVVIVVVVIVINLF